MDASAHSDPSLERGPRLQPGRTEHPSAAGAPAQFEPLPRDLLAPQFTLRAVLTGMVLAGLLSICNLYVGLKVGIGINMSIIAALLGFGFWGGLHQLSGRRVRPLSMLENNINQTACSSGAAVTSAGLVAQIPALTLVTGQTLAWHLLALWLFSVMLIGITVAIAIRHHMLSVEKLPFPSGVVAAETLRELHARGRDATTRALTLLFTGLAGAGVQFLTWFSRHSESLPAIRPLPVPGMVRGITLKSLTFAFEPTLFFYALGAMIGFRTCLSLLIGAVLAHGLVAPRLIEQNVVGTSFRDMLEWFVWPGMTLMVVSALVSLVLSWRSFVTTISRLGLGGADADHHLPRRVFIVAILAALLLSVTLQVMFFQIIWWVAALGVLLVFVLALVAARVVGETGITPVGQMSKVTQLLLGFVAPATPAANLMGANVAAGAASQSGDLLPDLRCGQLIGASARAQSLAQMCGACAGALVGALVYLALIPDPRTQLLTEQWPAPGVITVKAVAELFVGGFHALPAGVGWAMLIAAAVGVILSVAERLAPRRLRPWTLSPASVGLALVIPAGLSLTMFVGGLAALLLGRFLKSWTQRFLVVVCAGLIAGDTLTGVATAFYDLLAPAAGAE